MTRTHCPYCSLQCGMVLEGRRTLEVRPWPEFPVNEGALCRKGWTAAGLRGHRERLTTPLVERDGRIYWTDKYLDTEEGRRVLDVTDLGIHSLPLKTLNPGGRVTAMDRDGRTLRLTGDVVNPLRRILPNLGGLDLSPILLFVIVQVLLMVVTRAAVSLTLFGI